MILIYWECSILCECYDALRKSCQQGMRQLTSPLFSTCCPALCSFSRDEDTFSPLLFRLLFEFSLLASGLGGISRGSQLSLPLLARAFGSIGGSTRFLFSFGFQGVFIDGLGFFPWADSTRSRRQGMLSSLGGSFFFSLLLFLQSELFWMYFLSDPDEKGRLCLTTGTFSCPLFSQFFSCSWSHSSYWDLGRLLFRFFHPLLLNWIVWSRLAFLGTSLGPISCPQCLITTGFFSRSQMEGRREGFSFSMDAITSASSFEQMFGIRENTPAQIFRYRPWMSVAVNGGFWAHISQSTHPKDQMSLFWPQGLSCHTSGLQQQGVPVCVLARPCFSTFEMFRSPSLQVPSAVMKMLADFKSLWSTLLSWSDLIPLAMWTKAFHISASSMNFFFFECSLIFFMMSPCPANSSTMHRLAEFSSQKESLQPMIWSPTIEARILISLRALALSFSFMVTVLIFFIAQIYPSSFLLTLKTCPNAPSPSRAITSKSFALLPFSIDIGFSAELILYEMRKRFMNIIKSRTQFRQKNENSLYLHFRGPQAANTQIIGITLLKNKKL